MSPAYGDSARDRWLTGSRLVKLTASESPIAISEGPTVLAGQDDLSGPARDQLRYYF